MSRIGKKPVFVPAGVAVTVDGQTIAVKGPKGELTLGLHEHAHVTQTAQDDGVNRLDITVDDGERNDRAIWGTMRALVAQMIEGVTKGWKKALELNGVGFRMNLQGTTLVMALGFSHDVRYTIPQGVTAKVENNVLTLESADAALVGQVAAEIRALKKPEPYKGKGFRYTDEVIRRKAGKAAKSGE